MNAKTALSCLLGVLMLTLTACGSAELMREKDRENVNLRRQVEQLRAQVQAKEDEARKLADQLAEAKKLQTQVMALEDRLRVMDDMMMKKSEDLAKMEAQLAAAKEAAAKPARARKGKPAKAKAEAAAPNVDMMGKAAEPAMKAPEGDAKAPAADAKP
jgi:TolA-binding protein